MTNEQKVDTLQKAFFPKPPKADLTNMPATTYPQEAPCETEISLRQIHNAINRLAPNKAPGPDEIANRVLKNTLPTIENHIRALMQAMGTAARNP